MRIVTWNIRKNNLRAKKAVQFALSQNPDILCLQEVSLNVLEYLREIPGYSLHASYDFISKNPKKHGYTVTMTKFPVVNEMEIPYKEQPSKSMLDRFLYQKINRSIEQHNAILVTITQAEQTYHIVNTRLSCAINVRERLIEFKNLITRVPTDHPVIFCGDYNVSDSRIFNRLTGWVRGFKKPDYMIDERKEFEEIFSKFGLLNIFRGHSTSISNRPLLQFDHILIPKNMSLQNKAVLKKRFGSDHKMLSADVV